MGACASVPKGMKGEASAPLPEPAKEESVHADQHITEEVAKVDQKQENDTKEVDETKQQSLGSLFDEVSNIIF